MTRVAKGHHVSGNGGTTMTGNGGGGGGNGRNGHNVVIPPPTSEGIKTDFLVDTCRRNLTISSAHFFFGLLSFMLCLVSVGILVYTLNHVSTELANLRSDIARVHADMDIVNKRHFMLAQDWCSRMNPTATK